MRAEIQETLEKTAYKENWDEAKKRESLKAEAAKALGEIKSSTCFSLYVESSDYSASVLKYWHGTVVQGENKLPLVFSDFNGFANTTHTTRVSGSNGSYFGNTTSDTTYELFSKACTKQPIDTTKPFKVVYEPRFDDGIDPMELEWMPKTVAQNKPVY